MLVLELLAKKSMYGYEMIQTLKGTSEDFFALKEGTLYPILYRLEDNDFAKSSWSEPKDGKAPKKYYEITKKGRERDFCFKRSIGLCLKRKWMNY